MINSKNLESLLEQSTRPVSTTSKSILASAITLPNGCILSGYTNESSKTKNATSLLDSKKLNLIALLVYQQLSSFKADASYNASLRSESNKSLNALGNGAQNEDINRLSASLNLDGLAKFEKVDDEGLEIYLREIPNTEFKVILVTEKGYPDGIIKVKTDELVKNLKELENFEYSED